MRLNYNLPHTRMFAQPRLSSWKSIHAVRTEKKRIFAQCGFLLESRSLFCEKELTITKTFKFKLCNIVFSFADYMALSGTRIINSSSNCFQEPSK